MVTMQSLPENMSHLEVPSSAQLEHPSHIHTEQTIPVLPPDIVENILIRVEPPALFIQTLSHLPTVYKSIQASLRTDRPTKLAKRFVKVNLDATKTQRVLSLVLRHKPSQRSLLNKALSYQGLARLRAVSKHYRDLIDSDRFLKNKISEAPGMIEKSLQVSRIYQSCHRRAAQHRNIPPELRNAIDYYKSLADATPFNFAFMSDRQSRIESFDSPPERIHPASEVMDRHIQRARAIESLIPPA